MCIRDSGDHPCLCRLGRGQRQARDVAEPVHDGEVMAQDEAGEHGLGGIGGLEGRGAADDRLEAGLSLIHIFRAGVERLAARDVFGKILVEL